MRYLRTQRGAAPQRPVARDPGRAQRLPAACIKRLCHRRQNPGAGPAGGDVAVDPVRRKFRLVLPGLTEKTGTPAQLKNYREICMSYKAPLENVQVPVPNTVLLMV